MLIKVVIGIVLLIGTGFVAGVRKNSKIPSYVGIKNGKFSEMPNTPNAVSSQTTVSEKKVEPFYFKGDLEESKNRIKDIIASYDNAKIITEESNYIHVVFTTAKMKYNDDVEFYFDEKEKKIDYRSESRVGRSDFGVNKARYDEIRAKY